MSLGCPTIGHHCNLIDYTIDHDERRDANYPEFLHILHLTLKSALRFELKFL